VGKEDTVWKDLELLNRALECASNDELRERFASFIKLARVGITDTLEREYTKGNVMTHTFRNITGADSRIELLREKLHPVVPKSGPSYAEFAFNALNLRSERSKRKAP
jgi:hypothetical protein